MSTLKVLFSPSIDDPLMYFPYYITISIGEKISEIVKIKFEFDKYSYYLECFQVD